jgi:hypothetical protein
MQCCRHDLRLRYHSEALKQHNTVPALYHRKPSFTCHSHELAGWCWRGQVVSVYCFASYIHKTCGVSFQTKSSIVVPPTSSGRIKHWVEESARHSLESVLSPWYSLIGCWRARLLCLTVSVKCWAFNICTHMAVFMSDIIDNCRSNKMCQ